MDLMGTGFDPMSWVQTAIYLGLTFFAFRFARHGVERYRVSWGLSGLALLFFTYNKEGDLHEEAWKDLRSWHQQAIIDWGLQETPWLIRIVALAVIGGGGLITFVVLLRRGMRLSRGGFVVLAGFGILFAYAGLRFFAGQKESLEGSMGEWIEMMASVVMAGGVRLEFLDRREEMAERRRRRRGPAHPRRRHKDPSVQALRHPRWAFATASSGGEFSGGESAPSPAAETPGGRARKSSASRLRPAPRRRPKRRKRAKDDPPVQWV